MKFTARQKALLDETMSVLDKWDFSLTIQKLQEPDYAGWTERRALAAERDYKRYLALTKVFDGYQPVPNGDIDRFWHEHILDTRRYAEDMDNLFGYFLHHYPFFGMRGEEDNRNWEDAVEKSNDMWSTAFGEPLYGPEKAASILGDEEASAFGINISSGEGDDDMAVQITITISVGDNGGVKISTEDAATAARKCPQACPNPGMVSAAEARKCPQACPNPGMTPVAKGGEGGEGSGK